MMFIQVDTDEFLVGLRELGIMLKKEESDVINNNFMNKFYQIDYFSNFG